MSRRPPRARHAAAPRHMARPGGTLSGQAARRSPPSRRAVAGIAGVSAIGTLLSRVTGLGRTLLQTYTLGVGAVGDAYNLANTTPNIVFDLVAGGVLAATLVPVFLQALREDEAQGWEGISAVCTTVTVFLVAVTVVFGALGPLIIRFYTLALHTTAPGAERSLATALLYLLIPQVVFYGITTLATAILVARESYAAPMYTPILTNVVAIGVLIWSAALIGSHPTPAGVHHHTFLVALLGLGTTAGVAAMALGLMPALRRAGARLRWVWDPGHPLMRRVLRVGVWTAGVVVANQVAYVVVILIANHHPGDYTAYSLAYQFFQLPNAIWIVSLLGPMERGIAHEWQTRDREGVRRSFVEAMWLGMVVIIPAGLGLTVLARPAITLVTLHGNVTAAGARSVANALVWFAPGLPTFGMYFIVIRGYQAVQDTRGMFVTYAVENALNVVLALILYPRYGISGLAASWSLAYAIAGFGALAFLIRRFDGVRGRTLAIAAGLVLVAAAAAAVVAWGVSAGLAHVPGGTRQLGIAARVVIAVGAGVTVYFLAARTLGFAEIRATLHLRRPPA